ncbi:MAG: hypothetical protein U1F36_08340 [Planctomycetota bacterium]
MTKNKKKKRAIRERAEELGLSYSTARSGMGIGDGAHDSGSPITPSCEDPELPEEVIPPGLHQEFTNDHVAIHVCWAECEPPSRMVGTVTAPTWAVAYAIVGANPPRVARLAVDKPVAIVFARHVASEGSPWLSVARARQEYPAIQWETMSAVGNGVGPGQAPSRYWVQWLTRRGNDEIVCEPGRRGCNSLAALFATHSRTAPE